MNFGNENLLKEYIKGRVEPNIYAFSTETIPNYLKVGDTYRPVSVRIEEWKKHYPNLEKKFSGEAKVNDNIYFRDYSVHTFLEKSGKKKLEKTDIKEGIYYSKEFFKDASEEDVKKAIEDIKENYEENTGKYDYYETTELNERKPKDFTYTRSGEVWELRKPLQQDAVDNFEKAVKNGRTNLLMYAVMRFGKSFTSLMCAEEIGAKFILVVSAKADVKDEWKKTVEVPKNFENYVFLTSSDLISNENENNDLISKIIDNENKKVVLFLTLQDLQGDEIKEKHKEVFNREIDLLIVDETHFGARAEQYGKVLKDKSYTRDEKTDKDDNEFIETEDALNEIKKLSEDKVLKAKIKLHLSGTPYRILMGSEFEKEDIICYCQYSDIVKAQKQWDKENEENLLNDKLEVWDNPYYGFPQMLRFAFHPSENARNRLEALKKEGCTYAFSKLFETKSLKKDKSGEEKHKQFKDENVPAILELFKAIDGSQDDENVFGFLAYDKIKNGGMCRHIVCVLPYCASCDALEELLKNHSSEFRNLKDYQIINISGMEGKKKDKDPESVKAKIKEYEAKNQKTLTLTVNKMLTGSTVPQWDTMIYLKDTSSPQEYDQAIFRLQNQYIKEYKDENGRVIKYNMKPQTLLVDFDPNRMFTLQEQKALVYNTNNSKKGNDWVKDRIEKEINDSPILTINAKKIEEVKPSDIMQAVSNYSKNRGVVEETLEIPVDLSLLKIDKIKLAIQKQSLLGEKGGLKTAAVDETEGQEIDSLIKEGIIGKGSKQSTGENGEEKSQQEKEEDNLKAKLEKKFRTYYTRLLFYAFIADDEVYSLSTIIDSIGLNEKNAEAAINLDLDTDVLRLMNDNIDPFILNQLDYKIQNISDLSHEENMIESVNTAVKKFQKLSESEVATPKKVREQMVNYIPEDELNKICDKQGRILDLGGKMGEFAIALYEKMVNGLGRKPEEVKNIIYTIPTSPVAYEFTKKVYEILDLNTDNIAKQFNAYDLLNVENEDLKDLLLQDKKFSEIELERNLYFKKGNDTMEFDYIIGNPPYHEEVKNNGRKSPIYNYFMDAAFSLSDKVELITPARFLFNAGQTPKDWNRNMLDDEYFRVLYYEPDSKKIFPSGSGITAGVAITYRDTYNASGPIGAFYPYGELQTISKKVDSSKSVKNIIIGAVPYHFSDILRKEHPEYIKDIPNSFDLRTNIFDRLNNKLFFSNKPTEPGYVKILGNLNDNRTEMWIKEKYITVPKNFNSYKILLTESGSGTINSDKAQSIISEPFVVGPSIGHTQTFISIGKFETEQEAEACLKYIKTRFTRFMLGILKVTQHNPRNTWAYVPLQDFTSHSDIDWSKSVDDIDQQLYAKYGLDENEINFIESHIKPME